MQFKQPSLTKGFTLVELIIVVAIIGLLATLAIVSLTSAQVRARDTKRVADIKSIQTALEYYYNAQGKYPVIATGDSWTTVGGYLTGYINALPVDPKGGQYKIFENNQTTPTKYLLEATIENRNSASAALDQDTDNPSATTDFSVASYVRVTSASGNPGLATVLGGTATEDCGDPGTTELIYCITGDATVF